MKLKGRAKHAMVEVVADYDAYLLRENTGTTGLEQTSRTAAAALAHYDIPHLIVGGLAVQEHGYAALLVATRRVPPHGWRSGPRVRAPYREFDKAVAQLGCSGGL
jgi:hypothetical protein